MSFENMFAKFGPRVKELREAAGMSRDEFSRAARIGKGTLQKIEAGQTKDILWSVLYRIQKALKTDIMSQIEEE